MATKKSATNKEHKNLKQLGKTLSDFIQVKNINFQNILGHIRNDDLSVRLSRNKSSTRVLLKARFQKTLTWHEEKILSNCLKELRLEKHGGPFKTENDLLAASELLVRGFVLGVYAKKYTYAKETEDLTLNQIKEILKPLTWKDS